MVFRGILRVTLVSLLSLSPVLAVADDGPRFRQSGKMPGNAEWVSVDGDRISFGAERRVQLLRGGIPSGFALGKTITEAVLVRDYLYLNHGDSLEVLEISAPLARPAPLRLAPQPRGSLHLSRTADFLIVAEDGFGLRIVTLLAPLGFVPSDKHRYPTRPTQVGSLSFEETFTAVAALGHHVDAAVAGKGIVVVDIANPKDPRVLRYLPVDDGVRAMATNGSRLYTLGTEGLTVIDLSAEEALVVEGNYPDIGGISMEVSGRTIHIAGPDQGVITVKDQIPLATTHFVTVGNFFFAP